MDADDISYVTLRKIQQAEKTSSTLTKIDEHFYERLSRFIADLNERLSRESVTKKQMLLGEEIQNIEKIATSIYEQREKKILLAAMSKSRGGTPNIKNLIDGEKQLFDEIYNLLKQSRKTLLEGKTQDVEKTEEETADKDEMGTEKPRNKNPIVRILTDIPEFVGTDTRTYNLRAGDILSLPPDICHTLTKRNVAEEISNHL